jgi:hypothetical protein
MVVTTVADFRDGAYTANEMCSILTWDVLTEEAVAEMEKEFLAYARSLYKRWYDDC